MAKPLRLEFAGALYHVTARGDRQENIYVRIGCQDLNLAETEFNTALLKELEIERRGKADRFLRVSWKEGSPFVATADFMVYGALFNKLTEQPKIHDYFAESTMAYFVVSPPNSRDIYLLAYDMVDKEIINARKKPKFRELNSPELLTAFQKHYQP